MSPVSSEKPVTIGQLVKAAEVPIAPALANALLMGNNLVPLRGAMAVRRLSWSCDER